MISCAHKALSCPFAVFGGIVVISALALAGALASQFIGHLQPCILCLYQRTPFVTAIILGLIGLALRKNDKAAGAILALCTLAFLVNSGIATYHSGVERGVWESAVEGCKIPNVDAANTADWIDKIMTTPSVPCTQIQWKDPVLGLTMANYNALLNLALFVICAAALKFRQCPSGSESHRQP